MLPALYYCNVCGATAAANVILCALEVRAVRYLSGAKEPRARALPPPQLTRFASARTEVLPRPGRLSIVGLRPINYSGGAAIAEKRERLQCRGNVSAIP